MRRILFFFFLFSFFFFNFKAYASEGWIIENFNSEINIQKDGVVFVSETISVDFNSLSKHGIYRDIPYVYDSNGEKYYSEIDNIIVLQNNSNAKYIVDRNDNYIRIRIGDEDKLISGKNIYVINYSVKGVLRGFPTYDELYWNVTGNNWPVPIQKASAKVSMPEDSITKITCFEGFLGSTKNCQSDTLNSKEATFTTTSLLIESEGLTVVVGYKKNIIPILNVAKPKTFFDKFLSFPSFATLITSILFGFLTVFILWFKYGRDYWFKKQHIFDPNSKPTVKPVGERETIVVEFTPPENFRPAEIGVLVDERADTLDVVATIIDLATRGYLTIAEVDKKWIFGKTDYILTKQKKSISNLLSFEKDLLDKIFKTKNKVYISKLKNTFYEELREIKKELYRQVVLKKIFPTNPEKVRTKYFIIALVIFILGTAIAIFSVNLDLILIFDIGLGIITSGILLAFFSQFMPRRTAEGRDLYRRTKGFELFISKAEKYRQQFFEKENMFNEVLSYAIVFGLTEKFATAMKNIGLKPEASWYTSSRPFSVTRFSASINSFSGSLSTAIASTPKGSGFSGGGGSGGGFGGGGGGSW